MAQQLTKYQIAEETFKKHMTAYEKAVLPRLLASHGISPEQFIQIVISEVKRSDKLMQALMVNPTSMLAAILQGAEIGLMPSEELGEYFLIPRNLKQPNGQYLMTVCGMLGYRGLVNILYRSGDITRIHTEVVYEGDEFIEIRGLEPDIIHKPNRKTIKTASKITDAYAVAKNKFGEKQFHVMSRAEIIAVQNMAKVSNELYFNDTKDPNRWMLRKTALIQLAKMLPKDYYATKAIAMDQKQEGGAYLTMDDSTKTPVIVEGTPMARPSRYRNIYGTLSQTIAPGIATPGGTPGKIPAQLTQKEQPLPSPIKEPAPAQSGPKNPETKPQTGRTPPAPAQEQLPTGKTPPAKPGKGKVGAKK